MGPANHRGLAKKTAVAAGAAVVACLCAALSCRPVGPREVTGGENAAPSHKGALLLLAEPGAARIVAAERSGTGSRLVLIDERGATVRPLTEEPVDGSIDLTPAWSPDGEWILFASSRGRSPGELSLWIVPVFAGGGARQLTAPPTVDMTPAWSPDGRTVAWASTRGGAGFDIWTARFVVEGGVPQLRNPRAFASAPGVEETMPTWSQPGDVLLMWLSTTPTSSTLTRQTSVDGSPEGSPAQVYKTAGVSWPRYKRSWLRGWAVSARASAGASLDLRVITLPASAVEVASDLGDEIGPAFSVDDRYLFATSVVRTEAGDALWSSVVFVDLDEDPPRLRALYDKDPKPRLGVDVAPVTLDAKALGEAPEYREGLKQVLTALGLKPE